MSLRGSARFVVALAVGLVAAPAGATNGTMPRTPPVYPPHACLATVDRSVDPSFGFKVGIPYEDIVLTEDELPDSRTFQFFALCHDDAPHVAVLPNWVSMDDAQRSVDIGIIESAMLPDAEGVLRTASHWATGHDGAMGTCVQAIEADDARIPISCDATQDGVVWDTSAVPAGNYVIRGYTFAPAANLWTGRSGVVSVHDGVPLPVAAFASPIYEARVYQQTGYRVLGCMGGPAGTKVTLAWASITDLDPTMDDPSVWTDFAELDAGEGAFDVLLVPPEAAIYLGLVLRATAVADTGPTWVAYASGLLTIYPGDDASDDPEVPPGPDRCEVGPEPTAGLELDSGGSDSSDADATTSSQAGDGSGCGCRQVPRTTASGLVLLVVVTIARRRAPRSGSRAGAPTRPMARAAPIVPK